MMTKRVVALVLAFAMTFSFAGFLAFADGGNPIEEFFEGDFGDYDFATNASFPAFDEEDSPITVFTDGGNPIEVFFEGGSDDFATIYEALAFINEDLTEPSWADIVITGDYTFTENVELPWFVIFRVQENVVVTTDGFILSGSTGERSTEVRLEKGVTFDGFKEYNNYYWNDSWTQDQYRWEYNSYWLEEESENWTEYFNLELIFNGDYSVEPSIDLSVGQPENDERLDSEGRVCLSLTSLDLNSDYTVDFESNTYLRYVIPVESYSGWNVFRLQIGTGAPIYIETNCDEHWARTWDQPVTLIEYEDTGKDMVAAFSWSESVHYPLHEALAVAQAAGNGQITIFGDYDIGRDSYLVVPDNVSIEALGDLTISNGNTLIVGSGCNVEGFGTFYKYGATTHTTEPEAGILYEWFLNDAEFGTAWHESPYRAYANSDETKLIVKIQKRWNNSYSVETANERLAEIVNEQFATASIGVDTKIATITFTSTDTLEITFTDDGGESKTVYDMDSDTGFSLNFMREFYTDIEDEWVGFKLIKTNITGQEDNVWIVDRDKAGLNFNDAEWSGYEWAMDAIEALHELRIVISDNLDGKFYPEETMNKTSLTHWTRDAFRLYAAKVIPQWIESPATYLEDPGVWQRKLAGAQDYFVHDDYGSTCKVDANEQEHVHGTAITLDLNKDMTRADLAFYIVKLLNLPLDVTITTSYSDISSLHPDYQKAITVVETIGFMKGYGDGKFHPNATITRADMTVMLKRALDYGGGLKNIYYINMRPGDWYYTAAMACYAAGLFTDDYGNNVVYWDENVAPAWDNVSESEYNAIVDNGIAKGLFTTSTLKNFATLDNDMKSKYSIANLTLACVAEYLAPLLKDISQGQIFTDVSPDDPYYDGVMYVISNNLILGDSSGKFNPNDDITEGEVYKALDTVLGITSNSAKYTSDSKIKLQVAAKLVADALFGSVVNGANTFILKSFNDSNAIDPENRQAMAYFIYAGIIEGITHGNDKANLQPNKNLTRADFSVFLARAVAGIDTSKMKDYERNVTGGVQ